MAAADPYVLVEDEIRSGLEDIESRLYDDKLENLVRENAATGTLKSLQVRLRWRRYPTLFASSRPPHTSPRSLSLSSPKLQKHTQQKN